MTEEAPKPRGISRDFKDRWSRIVHEEGEEEPSREMEPERKPSERGVFEPTQGMRPPTFDKAKTSLIWDPSKLTEEKTPPEPPGRRPPSLRDTFIQRPTFDTTRQPSLRDTGKPIPQPADFYIDADICMNCGLCAEYCPFDAIKMDHDYEIASYARNVYNLDRLMKPASYYAGIRPLNNAREEEARRAKEAAKAARAKAA